VTHICRICGKEFNRKGTLCPSCRGKQYRNKGECKKVDYVAVYEYIKSHPDGVRIREISTFIGTHASSESILSANAFKKMLLYEDKGRIFAYIKVL
jgi:hypothetical protein